MLSGITSLLRLSGQSWRQFQYWREFDGERIQIRSHSSKRGTDVDDREGIQQTNYVIEGDIEKVMSVPPGFMLKNVTEYIYLTDYSMVGFHENFEYQTHENRYNRQDIREVSEKFVSFDSIEQLEKAEHAEEAVEPFRDEQRQNPEQAIREEDDE